MKKILSIVFLTLCSLSISNAKIPTIDIGVLHEAQEQLKKIEEQINLLEQAKKDAERRLEGFTNFGKDFESLSLDEMLNQVQKGADSFNFSLADYGIDPTGFEGEEHKLKSRMGVANVLEEQRKKIRKLREQFERAQTPQEREELGNLINILMYEDTLLNKQIDVYMEQMENVNEINEAQKMQNVLRSKILGEDIGGK